MAVADANDYAKGSFFDSDQDWYHGQLTRAEAEQALRAAGRDCFLIRESKGALVLSFTNEREFYHIKIEYGIGWFKLNTVSVRFTSLDNMLSYYHSHCISDNLKMTLGEVCTKNADSQPADSSVSNIYSKGEPTDLLKYVWFHGNVSKDQAIQELQAMKKDAFLVRQDGSDLILSIKVARNISHQIIHRYSGGYGLEGRDREFASIPELITHYQQFPCGDTVLGAECAQPSAELALPKDTHMYAVIPTDPTKYQWYHNNITEEEASFVLRKASGNCFLVRSSVDHFILSCQLGGYIHHFTVTHHSEDGYHLQDKEEHFQSIPDLVTYYRHTPPEQRQLLGTPCDREQSVSILKRFVPSQKIKKQVFTKETNSLRISWRKCTDMTIPTSSPQLVKIGKYIYAGGGMKRDDSHYILKYNLQRDTWNKLPYCPTYQHGLATLDKQLLVIGGKIGLDIVNTVYNLVGSQWVEVLPPMPTARTGHSTLTHEDRIVIAAGGVTAIKDTGKSTPTDAVEIYVTGEQWYSTKRMPFATIAFSFCILNDTCYILGGTRESSTTVYTSVSSLIKNAEPVDGGYSVPQSAVAWDQLRGQHPLMASSVTELDGKLFALGGTDGDGLHQGTRYISNYDFATDTWVECKGAELPVPIYRSTVMNLGNNEVICVGGQTKSQQFSAEVFIGTYSF